MRFRDRSGTTRDSVVRRHFFQAEDSADAMSVSINARPRRVRLNRRLSHLWPSSAIRRLCLGLAGLERGAGRARRDQEQRCKQTEGRSHSTMRLPAAPFWQNWPEAGAGKYRPKYPLVGVEPSRRTGIEGYDEPDRERGLVGVRGSQLQPRKLRLRCNDFSDAPTRQINR